MTASAIARQWAASPLPASTSMLAANCRHTSVRSAGPWPLSTSILSMTSRLLPMLCPSGVSISVIMAATRRPWWVPMATISCASSMLWSTVFINAPVPVVTSSRMASEPEASFLDMMLDAISGMQLTVAVTSRRAYIFLSATAMPSLWPMTDRPIWFTCAKNSSCERAVFVPGTLSILSMVPPVWPKPRPLILAIFTPQAATMGAMTSVVLSPTPPVECLSTLMPGMGERSTITPLCAITSVSSAVSSLVMPRRYTAIIHAAI